MARPINRNRDCTGCVVIDICKVPKNGPCVFYPKHGKKDKDVSMKEIINLTIEEK